VTKKKKKRTISILASPRKQVATIVSKLIYEDALLDLLVFAFPHSGIIYLQSDIFPFSKLLIW